MTTPYARTAVIPVAGLATRMQPIARAYPKEMLPLGNRPVLHHVVEELVDGGIRHIVFVVGSRSESIERYFHHLPDLDQHGIPRAENPVWSKALQCSFTFVRQDEPLGVVDAVNRAHWAVGDHSYLVHMGDSVIYRNAGLIQRMITCHASRAADLTVAVSWRLPHPSSARGVAVPVGTITDRREPFQVERFAAEGSVLPSAPFVIGRYLVRGPMPRQPAVITGPARFGGLTQLMPRGEEASVMAVPLTGDEQLLGAGTLAEYFASWRYWLESERNDS